MFDSAIVVLVMLPIVFPSLGTLFEQANTAKAMTTNTAASTHSLVGNVGLSCPLSSSPPALPRPTPSSPISPISTYAIPPRLIASRTVSGGGA